MNDEIKIIKWGFADFETGKFNFVDPKDKKTKIGKPRDMIFDKEKNIWVIKEEKS